MDHVSDINISKPQILFTKYELVKTWNSNNNKKQIQNKYFKYKNFKYSITCIFWYDILKYKNSKMLLTEKFESEIIIS